jgi:hypothetical protein
VDTDTDQRKMVAVMVEQIDGTLQKLAAKYLAAARGTDPAKVPYFQP